MTGVRLGVIGGTGMLGSAMIAGLLSTDAVASGQLWSLSRSGRDAGFDPTRVRSTTSLSDMLAACDTVLFCVPPAAAADWAFDAPDKLILSVMAGVSRADLSRLSGSARVVRAMSSPAAATSRAFSPWIAAEAVSETDKAQVRALLSSCGAEAEVPEEDHIDQFTALTGPVPGFVAAFAEAVTNYALSTGIPPEIADTAVRQLFLASGEMLAQDPTSASDHVQGMIDYAGTTAAGLETLRAGPLQEAVSEALAAAYARTKTIGQPD